MENYIADGRIHEGHRSRMRAKLLAHGQRIFDTYELLEMLLYQVIPYKDTNPIAKRLLLAFGGLDGVLRADKEALTTVSGIGERAAEFISRVGLLSSVLGAEVLSGGQENFSNYETVGEFFVNCFRDAEDFRVLAVFLDNNMRPIEIKKLFDVDYESAGVKAKAFIDTAMRNHASVIITAHNHPHGPFYPTPGDRETNNAITSSLSMVGLVHAEHYLVCGSDYSGICSLKNFINPTRQTPALTEFINGKQRFDAVGKVCAVNPSRAEDLFAGSQRYNKRDLPYFASLLSWVTGDDGTDTARKLLIKYQTIENVITASSDEIISMTSEKLAFYIKLLGFITARRSTDLFTFGEKRNRAEISEYLKALFIGESVEKIYLLTFDCAERLTSCRLLGEGTVSSSEVLPRKACEAAISSSAAAVAIAHNHPFGNPEPSSDDIKFTGVFETLFLSCGIKLLGHYIIAGHRSRIIMPDLLDAEQTSEG